MSDWIWIGLILFYLGGIFRHFPKDYAAGEPWYELRVFRQAFLWPLGNLCWGMAVVISLPIITWRLIFSSKKRNQIFDQAFGSKEKEE